MKTRTTLLLAILFLVGFKGISQDLAKSVDLSAQYLAEINYADRIYSTKDYTLAKSAFQKINAEYKDNYSQYRGMEIDCNLDSNCNSAQAKVNYEYVKTIKTADEQFNKGNFHEARSLYVRAMSIKPTESYPHDRLAEIKHLIR